MTVKVLRLGHSGPPTAALTNFIHVLFGKNGRWQQVLLFSQVSRPTLRPSGYQGYFSGVNRPGREFNHSSLSTAKIKNVCIYTPQLPLHACMVWTETTLHLFTLHSSSTRFDPMFGLRRDQSRNVFIGCTFMSDKQTPWRCSLQFTKLRRIAIFDVTTWHVLTFT